jgi:hypothetical protein
VRFNELENENGDSLKNKESRRYRKERLKELEEINLQMEEDRPKRK